MPSIGRVLETSLYVDDLDRSIHFYTRLFGFEKMVSDDRFCALNVRGEQVLLLFRSGGTSTPVFTPGGTIPPHDSAGHLHFAFAISKEDFPAWEKHLIACGVTIESKVTWPAGGQSLYFRDPDHHLVELATPGLWEVY